MKRRGGILLSAVPAKTQDVFHRRVAFVRRRARRPLVGARHDAFCASEASKKRIGNSSPRAGPSSRRGESERRRDPFARRRGRRARDGGRRRRGVARALSTSRRYQTRRWWETERAASRSGGDADRELGEASRGGASRGRADCERRALAGLAGRKRRSRTAAAAAGNWTRRRSGAAAGPVARAEATAAAAAPRVPVGSRGVPVARRGGDRRESALRRHRREGSR